MRACRENRRYAVQRELEDASRRTQRPSRRFDTHHAPLAPYDAGETTGGQVAGKLDLEERDRICYLFDYDDEWRFYAILKEVNEDAHGDSGPDVTNEKRDPVESFVPPCERL